MLSILIVTVAVKSCSDAFLIRVDTEPCVWILVVAIRVKFINCHMPIIRVHLAVGTSVLHIGWRLDRVLDLTLHGGLGTLFLILKG